MSAPLSIDDTKQNDTDGDGLTDWQGVLCKNGLITGSSEIGYDLPTYEEYLRVAIPNDNFNVLEDFLSVKIGDFFYDHVKNQETTDLENDIQELINDGNIREGDLLFFCTSSNLSENNPGHTAVVGKVDKTNNIITYIQHGNYIHVKDITAENLESGHYTEVRLIHIYPTLNH